MVIDRGPSNHRYTLEELMERPASSPVLDYLAQARQARVIAKAADESGRTIAGEGYLRLATTFEQVAKSEHAHGTDTEPFPLDNLGEYENYLESLGS